MKLKMIALLAGTATLAAACGPSPGSAEWCMGVLSGKIQASEAELSANEEKCGVALEQQMKDALGRMGLPGQ